MRELREICRDLHEQNNRATAEPMFCVQIKVRDAGYDFAYADNRCWWHPENYADNRCWWHPEIMEVAWDDHHTVVDAEDWDDENDEPMIGTGWEGPYGYKERWETVMVAFTEKGCEDYLSVNGHNVRAKAFRGEIRTYVHTFYRCAEMIYLRKYLMGKRESD